MTFCGNLKLVNRAINMGMAITSPSPMSRICIQISLLNSDLEDLACDEVVIIDNAPFYLIHGIE